MSLQGLVNIVPQGVMGPPGLVGVPGPDTIVVYMKNERISILMEDLPEDMREYLRAQVISQKLEGTRHTDSRSGLTGPTGPTGATGRNGSVNNKLWWRNRQTRRT